MFGVDKMGHDVLAPQFRRGGRVDIDRTPTPGRDPEFEMALASTKMSVRADNDLLSKLRQQAVVELNRSSSRPPQEGEVRGYIDKEINRIALSKTEKGRRAAAESASRSAVLRT